MSQFCNCEYGDILLLAIGEAPFMKSPAPQKKKEKKRKKERRKKERKQGERKD